MTPGAEHAAQRLVRLLGAETGGVVAKQFGQSDDRIERGPQLMAHTGEELRLVPASDFELVALFVDLMEQSRILNRQHRLRRKGLHQVDDVLWERSGCPAADHQR